MYLRGAGISLLRSPPAAAAFLPTDIPGLQLWLQADGTLWQDSDRTTPAVADGNPVGAWDDGSGNARHGTQGTAAQRPTLKLGAQNGRAGVRFDGVDDRLALASSVASAGDRTYFLVFRRTAAGTHTSPLDGYPFNWFNDNVSYYYFGATVRTSPSSTATGAFVQTVGKSATASYARRNGSDVTLSGNIDGSNASSVVGFIAGSVHNHDVYEVLAYDSLLTLAQAQQVESYLNQRWGVY